VPFLGGEPRRLSHVREPASLDDKKSNQALTDGPLAIEPSSVVLQYAQTLFEGMKAYQDENGKVTLFRPNMNMERMNTSASRLALPVTHVLEHNSASTEPSVGRHLMGKRSSPSSKSS